MSWLTAAPTGADQMTHASHESSPSSEQKSGTWTNGSAAVSWAALLTTVETTDEWELDGFDQATAEAWAAVPPTTSKTIGRLQLGNGILSFYLLYVASESVTTRSISRSSDAGSYRLTLRTVTKATTAEKIDDPTPEE